MSERRGSLCRQNKPLYTLGSLVRAYCPSHPRVESTPELYITSAPDKASLNDYYPIVKPSFKKAEAIQVMGNGQPFKIYGENGVVKEGTLIKQSRSFIWINEERN